jgi:hypothetical protein
MAVIKDIRERYSHEWNGASSLSLNVLFVISLKSKFLGACKAMLAILLL